jgi:glycosyltransferase involved in cell wall biosynthesis
MKVSVVIPSIRASSISITLGALDSQTCMDFEVIVVADHSAEVHEAISKRKSEYPVMVIDSPRPGSIAARNEGIARAHGEIIAFTDDDCIPYYNWIEKAIPYFSNNEILGLEGAIVSNNPTSLFYSCQRLLKRDNLVYGRTANMFYRKWILEDLSGINENFTNFEKPRHKIGFFGDTDLAWRVMKYGKLPFASDVKIYHPVRNFNLIGMLQDLRQYQNAVFLLRDHPISMIQKLAFKSPRLLSYGVLPLKIYFSLYGLVRYNFTSLLSYKHELHNSYYIQDESRL